MPPDGITLSRLPQGGTQPSRPTCVTTQRVWLDAIDVAEMRELVIDAWTIVVPKRVAAEYLRDHPSATTTKQLPPVSARTTKSAPSG